MYEDPTKAVSDAEVHSIHVPKMVGIRGIQNTISSRTRYSDHHAGVITLHGEYAMSFTIPPVGCSETDR